MLISFASVAASKPTVTAYFEEWAMYTADHHVSDIPADKLTHINYAFAKVDTAGQVSLYDPYAAVERYYAGDSWSDPYMGNFNQLRKLKEQHPHLKVLISIGGWTLSGPFYSLASTEAGRQQFAQSTLAFLQRYEIFDGVDVDWEYPVIGGLEKWGSPADTENFTLLMKALRETLTDHYELTVAVNAGPRGINAIDYVNVSQYLDRINIMSYDLHGPGWSSLTGHNAALYNNNDYASSEFNIDSSVNNLITAGVPPEKLVVGLPFYGRSFANVAGAGINQPFSGAGSKTYEEGMLNYYDLADNYINKNGYQYYWDDIAKVPYLYHATKREFISFDDPRSIRTKSRYALDRNLNGVMFWATTGDNGDLTNAIQEGFANGDVDGGDSSDDPNNGDDSSNNNDSNNGDDSSNNNDDPNSGDDSSNNDDTNNGNIPAWSGAGVTYQVGDHVTYNGNIYRVGLAHTSVANWYPDQTWYFELVGAVTDNDDSNADDDQNNDGADDSADDSNNNDTNDDTDNSNDNNTGNATAWSGAAVSYQVGDQVTYDGKLYQVIVAHTSVANWYPDQTWYFELIGDAATDNSNTVDDADNNDSDNNSGNDDNNTGNIPAWSGAAVSYQVGDLVTYNGDTYRVKLAHTSVANWYPDAVWYFEKQ
ncbi:MAG: glycosyl hydrolase family 18 protein [bacterium]